MDEKKLKSIEKKLKKQEELINKLQKELHKEKLKNIIEQEVAKSIFHHTKSMQHRIDQFIFDANIELKNSKL